LAFPVTLLAPAVARAFVLVTLTPVLAPAARFPLLLYCAFLAAALRRSRLLTAVLGTRA
jgi:hypothetical protein